MLIRAVSSANNPDLSCSAPCAYMRTRLCRSLTGCDARLPNAPLQAQLVAARLRAHPRSPGQQAADWVAYALANPPGSGSFLHTQVGGDVLTGQLFQHSEIVFLHNFRYTDCGPVGLAQFTACALVV